MQCGSGSEEIAFESYVPWVFGQHHAKEIGKAVDGANGSQVRGLVFNGCDIGLDIDRGRKVGRVGDSLNVIDKASRFDFFENRHQYQFAKLIDGDSIRVWDVRQNDDIAAWDVSLDGLMIGDGTGIEGIRVYDDYPVAGGRPGPTFF